MKKTSKFLSFFLSLGLGLFLFSGCGLLDAGGGISVSLPEQSFDFSLDADQARGQLQAYLDAQGAPYDQIDLAGMTEIPAEVCDGSVCVDVPTFSETFEVEIPGQQIDLSDEEELRQYVESGKVKSVTIEYLQFVIDQNTLNFDMPSLDLYMDQLGTTALADSSDLIGKVPSIQAGSTDEGELQFTADGRDIMSNYLIPGLQFAMLGETQISVDTAVTRTIPGGQLSGQIKLKLKFTVDPL